MPRSTYPLSETVLKGQLPATLNQVLFLDSNNGSGGGGRSDRAYASLATIMANHPGLSSADTIMVAEGHAETISSATALLMNVAGVKVIGMGEGTRRPKFTLDTAATATIPVSVANVRFENCIFSANFADITSLFTLTAGASLTLHKCRFQATAVNMNFLSIVKTSTVDNAADGLTITECEWVEPDAATLYMVSGLADIDNCTIKNNYVNLGVNTNDLPALINMATGKDLTNLKMSANTVIRLNDANPLLVVTDTTTANTGHISDNRVRHLDVAGELLITAATNIGLFENKATAAVDASGYILPAVDS